MVVVAVRDPLHESVPLAAPKAVSDPTGVAPIPDSTCLQVLIASVPGASPSIRTTDRPLETRTFSQDGSLFATTHRDSSDRSLVPYRRILLFRALSSSTDIQLLLQLLS